MRSLALLTGVALFLALPGNLCAQAKTDRATVEWGPEMLDKKDGVFSEVFGHDDEAVYMIVFMKKERFIRKMDKNYKVVYQRVLPIFQYHLIIYLFYPIQWQVMKCHPPCKTVLFMPWPGEIGA